MNNITKLKFVYAFNSLYFFHPIITLFYFSRGLTLFQIMTLEAALCAAIVALEIPTGLVADKLGRKLPLCILLCCGIIVGIWTSFAHSYIEFLLIQVVFGLGLAFGSGAVESFVYESLAEGRRENEMAHVWGSINASELFARVLAVIIGGYIAKAHTPESYPQLFWLYATGAAIALLIALSLKEPMRLKNTVPHTALNLFKESTVQILKNESLRKIVYLTLATNPFVQVIGFVFQPYFLSAQVPAKWWGLAMALGNLLAAFLLTRAYIVQKKLGVNRAILLATVAPGLMYLGMYFVIGPVMSCLWYIGLRGVSNLRGPLLSQYTNGHIESYNRATVLSVISLVQSLYSIANKLLLGWLAEYSLMLTLLVMGVVIVVGAVIFRLSSTDNDPLMP